MMPQPTPPRRASRATAPNRAHDESSERRPLLDSDDSGTEDQQSVRHNPQLERPAAPSLATVQPQPFQSVTAFRQRFIRQILGLNPFRTSYFALYRSLDDVESRTILALGILLAVCAGVPLRT